MTWKDETYSEWNQERQKYCTHPAHNPPGHMVITQPYTHTCPSCGKQTTVYPTITYM